MRKSRKTFVEAGISVTTRDRYGAFWSLNDVRDLTFSTKKNGFFEARWTLDRDLNSDYPDFDVNYYVKICSRMGDIIWEGRIDGVTRLQRVLGRRYNKKHVTQGFEIIAIGYWASLADILLTNYSIPTQNSPEDMITYLQSHADPDSQPTMPYIKSLNLAATGYTSSTWQIGTTHVNSTQSLSVQALVQDICNVGTLPDVNGIINTITPAVWAGRVLSTSVLTDQPTARYLIRRPALGNVTLERRLSDLIDRVIIWYSAPAGGGGYARYHITKLDPNAPNDLGIKFPFDSARTPFIRDGWTDLSQTQNTSDVSSLPTVVEGAYQATNQATAFLNFNRYAKATGPFVISRGYSVFDVTRNEEISNWAVQAGNWVGVVDLFPRGPSVTANAPGGSLFTVTLYYISQTDYDATTGELRITAEKSNKLADMLQIASTA